jgi:hypothetical protein
MKARIVRLLEWRDQGVTRRDIVSGLDVVPPLDLQFFYFGVECRSFEP